MKVVARIQFFTVSLIVASGLMASCGPYEGQGPADRIEDRQISQTTDASGNDNNTSDDTTHSTQAECSSGDDCPTWACYCVDGPPVNSRSCRDGRCAHPTEFCDEFCDAFNTEWTGQYELIDDNDDGGSGTDSGSTSTDQDDSGSGTANNCEDVFNNNSCGYCGRGSCCEKGAACINDYNCSAITSCIPSCVAQGASSSYCSNYCINYFSAGASLYYAYDSCMNSYCYSECH